MLQSTLRNDRILFMTPVAPLFQVRSMGIKLIAVGILAIVMTVPALFVNSLVGDRTRRATEVSESIGTVLGGPQTFLGPVLAVPYTSQDSTNSKRIYQGVYVIFP